MLAFKNYICECENTIMVSNLFSFHLFLYLKEYLMAYPVCLPYCDLYSPTLQFFSQPNTPPKAYNCPLLPISTLGWTIKHQSAHVIIGWNRRRGSRRVGDPVPRGGGIPEWKQPSQPLAAPGNQRQQSLIMRQARESPRPDFKFCIGRFIAGLHFCVPQFPQPWNGDGNSTSLRVVVWIKWHNYKMLGTVPGLDHYLNVSCCS